VRHDLFQAYARQVAGMSQLAVESLSVGSDSSAVITLLNDIHFGHKFALKDIMKGTPVIKYGETIGLATEDTKKVTMSMSIMWKD
jgi:hypothetical protein